jgi:hypothetical protein
MTTTQTPNTEIRQTVAFFQPEDGKGKWHAKRKVANTADCGAFVILGDEVIHARKDILHTAKRHPIICGRCARLNGSTYSSERVL